MAIDLEKLVAKDILELLFQDREEGRGHETD